jgi:hypothetical protein
MKKILLTIWVAFITFFILSANVSAQDPCPTTPDGSIIPECFNVSILSPDNTTNPYLTTDEPIIEIILVAINKLVVIIGSFAILAIVAGGIVMIASSGNDQLQTRGKSIITYAIIGLIVALSAYIITSFVQALFY